MKNCSATHKCLWKREDEWVVKFHAVIQNITKDRRVGDSTEWPEVSKEVKINDEK
jgi:hypothetical protein